jgi:lipopolysaccharide export system protein LptA
VAYSRRLTITTTRQLIIPIDGSAQEVHFHSASGKVHLGGADVTADNGFEVDNGEKIVMLVHPGDAIYAITSAGSVTITLLVLTR